jgi:hypothetical protein
VLVVDVAKPAFVRGFELLQARRDLFERALGEYANARRGCMARTFIDVLTKGSMRECGLGIMRTGPKIKRT